MPDARFFETMPPLSLADAARLVGGQLEGRGAIHKAASIDEADIGDAVVYADNEYALEKLGGRRAGLVLISPQLSSGAFEGPRVVVAAPRLAFARLADRLHVERSAGEAAGVDQTAKIGAGAAVHHTAVIGADAEIGARASIGPYAVLGPGVVIGADAVVGAHVSIVHALVGARAAILAGARIGQAGFGFTPSPEGPVRIPQLGRVVIGDDVEIGANTTVDRGALGDTIIGDGVKIDNLVQIGHNVRIGRHSIIAAEVGISGSTIVGERVMMGGKVGIADHITIGDDAQIAAGAGVMRDIGPGEKWGGLPARPFRVWFRETATLAKLAEAKKKTRDGA